MPSWISTESTSLSSQTKPPHHYIPLPQRLIHDLRDTPVAIGVYSLIARLYAVVQAPVPLSTPDVQRFDPTVSRGAVLRAFDRLIRTGWLTAHTKQGHKSSYTPTWGIVSSKPRLWQMDAPALARPRHIQIVRLDARLLDTCMGKLTVHPTQPARIERYLTTPILALADVGAYGLMLAGWSHVTLALNQLGLIHDGQIRPLPPDTDLLALVSQQPLFDTSKEIALTDRGLGVLACTPASIAEDIIVREQPLFFVSKKQIGSMIPCMIGQTSGGEMASSANTSLLTKHHDPSEGITWNPCNVMEQGYPPLPPQKSGGGQERHPRLRVTRSSIPTTETAQLLRTIGVRPAQICELAEQPLDRVKAAIIDGQTRLVRDLAGWVVTLLRDARDY